MFRYISALILALFLVVSCSVKPQPIEYGTDTCAFCQMTIMDRQHAAEIVTQKGKSFKYDAIECMIRDLKNHESAGIAYYLVSDFAESSKLTNAFEASYLISENIPSPMGANLSAFKEGSEANRVQKLEGGQLYTWNELLKQF
jgi:copper chaperone NosL